MPKAPSVRSTKPARKTDRTRPARTAEVHPFWGGVLPTRVGFKPTKKFKLRGFRGELQLYLGEGIVDEDTKQPTSSELDALARAFESFLANEVKHFAAIRQAAFARYLKLYARYYEDARQGNPLGLQDADAHAKYLGNKVRIRVAREGVFVSFWYELDREHGLEFKFVKSKLSKVGGISDT